MKEEVQKEKEKNKTEINKMEAKGSIPVGSCKSSFKRDVSQQQISTLIQKKDLKQQPNFTTEGTGK